jgi:hypothetical protein
MVLVDLDASAMERARRDLAASLRERVRLLASDISGGVSDALGALLRVQPWPDLVRLSQHAVSGTAAAALERVSVPDPPPVAGLGEGSWGIVISSFVVTQLFSLPLLDTHDQLALVAPDPAGLEAEPRYLAAALHFRRRVALAHTHLLASLVAPGGTVLFMTDVTGHLLPPTAGPHASDQRQSLAVLPSDVLALPDDFAPRLRLLDSPTHWDWTVSESGPGQFGRAYDAVGALFAPTEGAGLAGVNQG